MRLRHRRAARAGRRSSRRWFPLAGGIFVLMGGAAFLAPLASSSLAPSLPGGTVPTVSATQAASLNGAAQAGAVLRPAVVVLAPTPTVLPLAHPTAGAVPTLTAAGQGLLAAIKSDRTAQWVRNDKETPLLSGPTPDAVVFTQLPQWSLLKQVESRPDWLRVEYGGDGDTRQAGPGWVRASDVGAVGPPAVWLNTARAGSVWSSADGSAKRVLDVPPTTLMEVLGPDDIQATRVHVRLPGDGRSVPPVQGWVDGDTVGRVPTPSAAELPWAYPDDLRADIRIQVPYRTQLDGSDYATANCGPTVLGMALETFGMNLAPPDLRGQVLNTEDYDAQDTDAGAYIWALARVAQSHGLQTHGLYDTDGSALHQWTLDEVRQSVRQGQPVILQVVYRGLPGREDSGYYGDHYIIVTGLLGDSFLYNDPIGGSVAHEAPGYDREMTSAQLTRAMRASDTAYAHTAFALSRS